MIIRCLIRSILVGLLASGLRAEEHTKEDERNGWIDPNDPLTNYRRQSPQVSVCERSESIEPTLKLILRSLFRQMHVDPSQRIGFYRGLKVQMGDYEMALIQDYLETSSSTPEQRDAVRNSLTEIFLVTDFGLDSPSKFQLILRILEPWIVPINLLVATLTLIFVMKSLFSSGSLIRILLLIIFVVSLFTSYNRMYQEKMAQRIAESMQRDDACKPQGLLSRTATYISSLVTIQRKSECLKFIESQTISVIFEISPMDVLFDVIGNSFFSLMEHFATRLNRATLALYDGLTLPLQLVVTVAVLIIFLVVFLFGIVQYRIGFFGLRIEPAQNGAGIIGQIGTAVNNVITSLEPPLPPAPLPVQHSDEIRLLTSESNITPRSKERMKRMLFEQSYEHAHKERRHRSPSPSPHHRSHSTPRIALCNF